MRADSSSTRRRGCSAVPPRISCPPGGSYAVLILHDMARLGHHVRCSLLAGAVASPDRLSVWPFSRSGRSTPKSVGRAPRSTVNCHSNAATSTCSRNVIQRIPIVLAPRPSRVRRIRRPKARAEKGGSVAHLGANVPRAFEFRSPARCATTPHSLVPFDDDAVERAPRQARLNDSASFTRLDCQ